MTTVEAGRHHSCAVKGSEVPAGGLMAVDVAKTGHLVVLCGSVASLVCREGSSKAGLTCRATAGLLAQIRSCLSVVDGGRSAVRNGQVIITPRTS